MDSSLVVPNEEDVPGTLFVETRDARFAVLEEVRPSEGPFELTLRPGVRIAGKVLGLPRDLARHAGVRVRIRLGHIQHEVALDRVDAFRFQNLLPAGRYAVEILCERLKGRIVGPEMIEGSDEEVVFRYEPAAD